jgi:hypothetical protein
MAEKPTYRLIEQRVRNRIIEVVLILARGDDGVREVWPDEYFESFFDLIPSGSKTFLSLTTLDEDEKEGLLKIARLVDLASSATPKVMTADELIATGWPTRIQPVAREALDVFIKRGRFDEDKEEQHPSSSIKWP